MGVHGLWELLAPVGRRVSVESLGSRRLAIDASIWIIQFMKAMRDDRGDMIRNAHLLGFFRRICKLLFLRVKPVFVFDGGTPALKRRTVIARRRQREQAQSKIRKTAEKLLLNHLRTRKLEEIAGKAALKATSLAKDNNNDTDSGVNGPDEFSSIGVATSQIDLQNQGSGDALLATAVKGHEKEENKSSDREVLEVQELNDWNEVENQHFEEEEEEEELVYLPSTEGGFDPAVLASLPASMQLELLVQMREQLVAENRHKFQKVAKAPSSFSQLQIEAYLKTVAFRRGISDAQKAAAAKGVGGVPSTRIASETNREFIFSSSFQGDKPSLTGEGGGNSVLPGLIPPAPKVQPPADSTSTLLSSNFRSLPVKEGVPSTELDEVGNADSTVQTYVDEKGRTRVSRVRGMGVRMTRDLQWNLYLMKDVQNRQALGESNDESVSALAESLVNSGDAEFQRLMTGDKANFPAESLPRIPFKDIDSNGGQLDKPAEDNSEVMPPVSSIQISFNSNEVAEDEDLDLFKDLVGDGTGQNPVEMPEELKPCSGAAAVAEEKKDDEFDWEDGDCQRGKEAEIGLRGSNPVEELGHWNGTVHPERGSYVIAPADNYQPFGGDSDAEMALAIQESLAEHDRMRAAQPGVYPDSEYTGPSDDSDTGDSGESEVEWEDGSGAVAVPAVGYTVTGLVLTQEELEFQEATRRSLIDVASWKAPVHALPQLVIREPVEGSAKGAVPRVGEQEMLATFDSDLQMDSEEARIARERARKGKAVADETSILPPVGVIRTAVSQAELEPAVGLPHEKMNGLNFVDEVGRGEVQAQPQGPPSLDVPTIILTPSLDAKLVTSVGAGEEEFLGQSLPQKDEEMKNIPPPNGGSKLSDGGNHVEIKEVGSDLVKLNAKPSTIAIEENVELLIETETEVPQSPGISRVEKPGIIEASAGANVVDSPSVVKPTSDGMSAVDDMIKDAEGMDMAKEQEDMLNHEAAILAEREALARDEAELQAALEKEREELAAGIEKERELLFQEEADLREMQKKNERNADSVTSEMFAECQELLQMFGIPYVIAPMEAEAQCAFLDAEKLVDGIVTDDVDVFLFGGRNVYKNIFDDRKYVETYYMKDVETDLGLTREKLIQMALLLGSDYTEGISGIGIVNAIEVVNAFDDEDGLKKFKEMVEAVDFSLLGFEGRGSKRKGSQGKGKGNKGGTNDTVDEDADIGDAAEIACNGDAPGDSDRALRQQAFMESHRAVSKNWKIPDSFPSELVVAEYKGPRVDKSKQSFSWGRPDLEALRRFCYERFSWSKDKADELLLSVLKEYDRHETQLRIDAFYSFNQRFAKVRSARIQKALRGTTGRLSKEMVDIPSPDGGPPAKKQKQKNTKNKGKKSSERTDAELLEEEADLNAVDVAGCEDLVLNPATGRGKGKKNKKASLRGGRGGARGRGRGRGRGTGRGRDRSSGVSLEEDGSSAHSSESDEGNVEIETGKAPGGLKRKSDEQLLPPRRSSRARKNGANYHEPAGSDDGVNQSESDEGVSGRSKSSNPPQLASRDFNDQGVDLDDHTAGVSQSNEGDVHPTTIREEATDATADAGQPGEPPKLYLFSGGGFCLPGEEDGEISGLPGSIPPESHGGRDEGQLNRLGSQTTDTQALKIDDLLAAGDADAQADANVGSGLRAMPFLRRKRPSTQP